jgi:hypothetical protein
MGASRRSSFGRAGAISTTSIPRADESNSRTLAIVRTIAASRWRRATSSRPLIDTRSRSTRSFDEVVRAIEKSHLQLIVRIEYGRRGSSWHRSMP